MSKVLLILLSAACALGAQAAPAAEQALRCPDVSQPVAQLNSWLHPTFCPIALCHGTCSNGANADVFDGVDAAAAVTGDQQPEYARLTPCPLRTFKHLLSDPTNSQGCCSNDSQNCCWQ